ncbi:hypothetical protein STEG23_018673, partial [Scotinomys teguina]
QQYLIKDFQPQPFFSTANTLSSDRKATNPAHQQWKEKALFSKAFDVGRVAPIRSLSCVQKAAVPSSLKKEPHSQVLMALWLRGRQAGSCLAYNQETEAESV